MRTVHIEPGAHESVALVLDQIEHLLATGRSVSVSIAQDGEWLAPQDVARRLGCSCQQVEWLIRTEELEAYLLGDGRCWQVSLDSVLDLEARRESACRRMDVLTEVASELRTG